MAGLRVVIGDFYGISANGMGVKNAWSEPNINRVVYAIAVAV